MVAVTINDKALEVPEGTSIIDAADKHSIYIPRFCYHKKLSVVANCRMCLVEIEGMKKPMPACATLVNEDMKVYTQSKMALAAQRAVMEFLLINHPLDCPICDQGGQCELQDIAMGFGHADSDYQHRKRAVQSLNLGPLIATDMTRCIHCTRCIRVGEEICGELQMGATQRGGHTEIGPYIAQTITSELSGNMIDVCPVGALTSKPDAAQTRPWELYEHPRVALHDCWGSHTYAHTKSHEYCDRATVMRTVPRECEQINEVWIADRDRFSYESIDHNNRLQKSMVKRNGQWVEVDLQAALLETVDKLQAVLQSKGGARIGSLCSPNASVETGYLLQKLMRCLGSENVDHRIHQLNSIQPDAYASLAKMQTPIPDIENCGTILLIGTDLRQEVPLANYRVLKAYQNDADIYAINTADYNFNYKLKQNIICHPNQIYAEVKALVDAIHSDKKMNTNSMASKIKASEKVMILLGHAWLNHPDALAIYAQLQSLAKYDNIDINVLTYGANSRGLTEANVLPGKNGHDANRMLNAEHLDALILMDVEPSLDCPLSLPLDQALKSMPLVICMTPYVNDVMLDYADILLPIAHPLETAGTWVNAANQWQHLLPATQPLGDARAPYKIIQAIAKLMKLEGFEATHTKEIIGEVKDNLRRTSDFDFSEYLADKKNTAASLTLTYHWHPLCSNSCLRHSQALQQIVKSSIVAVPNLLMSPETAQYQGFTHNDQVYINNNQEQLFTIVYDKTQPAGAVHTILGSHFMLLPHKLSAITLTKEGVEC